MSNCYGCQYFLNERDGICGKGLEVNRPICLVKEEGKPAEVQGTVLGYWEWNPPNGQTEQAPKVLRRGKNWELVHYKVKRVVDKAEGISKGKRCRRTFVVVEMLFLIEDSYYKTLEKIRGTVKEQFPDRWCLDLNGVYELKKRAVSIELTYIDRKYKPKSSVSS